MADWTHTNKLGQNMSLEKGKYGYSGDTKSTQRGPDPEQTFMSNVIDNVRPAPKEIKKDAAPLRYPTDLSSEGTGTRPMIRFTCFERQELALQRRTCYFPCPANIAFADNANLGTIDLGMVGASINDALNTTSSTGATGTLTKPISATAALAKGFGKMTSVVGAEGLVNNIKFGLRTVENPYQNTTYSGAGIRTFTFNFKLIAEKEEDAIEIKKIHEYFRSNMYAGRSDRDQASAAFLQYPSVWEIDFLTGITKSGIIVNKYLPAIYACYLQNFNATFNTTGSTWYKDGAPLEVDISMTFQEARALEKNDVDNLSSITMNEEGGLLQGDDLQLDYGDVANKGISNRGTSRSTGINLGEWSHDNQTKN